MIKTHRYLTWSIHFLVTPNLEFTSRFNMTFSGHQKYQPMCIDKKNTIMPLSLYHIYPIVSYLQNHTFVNWRPFSLYGLWCKPLKPVLIWFQDVTERFRDISNYCFNPICFLRYINLYGEEKSIPLVISAPRKARITKLGREMAVIGNFIRQKYHGLGSVSSSSNDVKTIKTTKYAFL